MHNFLKRMELQGFKSFAQKTVLEFPSRVTAIVGPNGSGKSNIIDGLRWVLGERGAHELRGDTLENLIFTGTAKRAALGFAKVEICFDNRDRELSFDQEEIVLGRKIDRSGVSHFFWNDDEIRLKDLAPILARAKLGTRGLTIIGQGDSDLFVKSGPRERRLMIEEILGLKGFRIKKDQAERRLESSQVNMDKVKSLIQELSPHLKFLRRQKNRFNKRSEVEQKLRETENRYFLFHYAEIKKAERELESPVRELLSKRANLEKEIRVLVLDIDGIGGTKKQINQENNFQEKINELFTKRLGMEKELARFGARTEFQIQNRREPHSISELTELIRMLANDIEQMLALHDLEHLKNKLIDWRTRLVKIMTSEVTSESRNLSEGIEKYKNELIEIDKEIMKWRAEEKNTVLTEQKHNEEYRQKIELLELKKNELRHIEHNLEIHQFEKEKLELKLAELNRRWSAFGRSFDELKIDGGSETKNTVQETTDWVEVERMMFKLSGELAAIGEIDSALAKEAEESEERYEFLNRELKDLTSASVDLKILIKELENKIHGDFEKSFRIINQEFNTYFRLMFGGGRAKMVLCRQKKSNEDLKDSNEGEISRIQETTEEDFIAGVDVDLNLPGKKISNLDMLSGGEKSLVSLAALFALISVSAPPFLVLDEIDAALDEENARRFANLIKEFSQKTQFIIVTHNRSTMESADILYGITMSDDKVSKVLSLKLDTVS